MKGRKLGRLHLGRNLLFVASHGITFVASVALTIIAVRNLAAYEFVSYGQISAFINMVVPACTLGLIPFIIRQFNNVNNRDFDLRFVSKSIFLIGSILSLIIVMFYGIFDSRQSVGSVFLSYIVILLTALGLIANSVSRAQRRPWRYLLVSAGGRALTVALIALMFSTLPELRSVEGILLATAVGLGVPLAASTGHWFPPSEHKKTRARRELRNAIAFTIPIALSNALVMSTPFFERILLTINLSDKQAAQYIFNFDLAIKGLALISIFLKLIIFPTLASGDAQDEARRFRRVMMAGLLGVLPALAILYLASLIYRDVVIYFSGSSVYANKTLFIMIGSYSLLFILNYIVTMGVLLTGRTPALVYSSLIFALSHIVGIMILTKAYGVEGVALSLIIAQFVATLSCYLLGNVQSLSYDKT